MTRRAEVAVLMGSDSDYVKLESLFVTLKDFSIPYTAHVISAHRTPEAAHEFSSSAEEKGYQVIICAAGLAAHLAGVIASTTILPVIGIPVEGGALNGLDALLATVQMPAGIPVATVGISNGTNAALLAAQIIARFHPETAQQLHRYKNSLAEAVRKKDRALQEKLSGQSI